MDSKRGAISFIFIIAFVIFSINLISADHCWVQQARCEDLNGGYSVMRLSDLTNAHGELLSQSQYDTNGWYLCCTFDGTNNCENGNKIIGLSASTNAHAQIPSLNSYTNPVCYSNLICQAFTQDPPCPEDYPIFMLYLSSSTNAHLAGSEDLFTPPTLEGYDTIICCQPNPGGITCGNGILEAGEACDDNNRFDGDGCSYTTSPRCQIEPGCMCVWSVTPTCCYCNPTSHWYLNGNPTQLNPAPDYNGIRLNDDLRMRFDSAFCMDPGTERTFDITEAGTIVDSVTARVVGSGSSGYIEATIDPILQSFLDALGIGHSDIIFSMIDPWYGESYATYNSYMIELVTKFCNDGECSAVDGENCLTCSNDCICSGATPSCSSTGTCIAACPDEYCDPVTETCSSCPEDCEPCIPSCNLISKSWSTPSALDGDTVQLTVTGNSACNGLSVSFQVLEYDLLFGDDPVAIPPSSATMSGGQATTSWVAEWPDTTGETGTLQYFFIPSTGGNSLAGNTPRLSVTQNLICGDCSIDGTETCDDGGTTSGDGCSASCQIESGYSCTPHPTTDCSICSLICGNGVVNSGEDCDSGVGTNDCNDVISGSTGVLACYPSGSPNECLFDTTGCSIPGVCTINTASWSATEVNQGDSVNLNVLTNNCDDGETISFVVEEFDSGLNPNDGITSPVSSVIVTGNIANGLWAAEYQPDTDCFFLNCETDPPEYIFTATIDSIGAPSESESINQLIVNELVAGCILIADCNDYDNELECTADACTVAENSVGPGITCGGVFDPDTLCVINTTCICLWDSNTNTCNGNSDTETLCGSCGNTKPDFGEDCDDGNNIDRDGCSSTCHYEDDISPPCPYGTTLCSDNTCSKDCYFTDTAVASCNYNTICDIGEGCTCQDCQDNVDTCATGLVCTIYNAACCNSASDNICDPECSYVDPDCAPAVCGNGREEVGEECDRGIFNGVAGSLCTIDCKLIPGTGCCSEGTAECEDETCSLKCYTTDISIVQDGDNCCSPLIFNVIDQACCRTTPDEICNPYCHYSDPDCNVIPSETQDPGNCAWTDITTDTCSDGVLNRDINGTWTWDEANEFVINISDDYWWDDACNGGAGCYRYDPFHNGVRESAQCVEVQDVISCPEQIQINFFGVYSLIAAIILIIFIYLIFFSRKKKKSHNKPHNKRRK